jgi:type II secretory pathway pseudopilin PulG
MDLPRARSYRRGMRNRSGFSLLELGLVLLVLGMLAALVVPPAGRARDGLAVRAARAELAGALAATRATAIRAGGAALLLDTESGDVWIETAAGVRLPTGYPLGARYGVQLTTDRTPPVALRFDALGIGRLTNASIRVQRGHAVAVLTVSAYGRVRT